MSEQSSQFFEASALPIQVSFIPQIETGTTLPIVPQNPQPVISPPKQLHRLAEVRKMEEISLANMARRLNMPIAEVRAQEKPTADILLSELYRWREVLDVPLSELFVEPADAIEDPIRSRAALVRVMKTVRSILETTKEKATLRMAQTLFDQLVEIMPELREITAWPSVGQSREFKDYGQALYRHFDSSVEQSMMD